MSNFTDGRKFLPDGVYHVSFGGSSIGKTFASGKTALKTFFTVDDEPYKGQEMRITHLLTSTYPVHLALNFLRELGYKKDEINYESIDQFEALVNRITLDSYGKQFEVKVITNTKGFREYEIVDRFF